MYSKILKHDNIDELELQLDEFLKDLDEVTGQITNMEMLYHNEEVIVLIIYNCWKKL